METFNTSNFLSKNYNNQLIFFNNDNLSHPNHIRYALANLPLLTFEVTDACNLKCKYCGYGRTSTLYKRQPVYQPLLG